ncbi:response regulator transcription factor [Natronorubrum sp. DTA7]|uniref:response regulator transcription factor n=1 Tax=Natronorubrum sp. DTA7 TaxID=3447016 RepID=UPI003F866FD0
MTARENRPNAFEGDASETPTDSGPSDDADESRAGTDRSSDDASKPTDTVADRSAGTAAARPADTPHVLLLEDDDSLRELLVHKLESSGYETTALADGRECWSFLSTGEPPDLALLDVMVPGLDGFRVLGRIRNDDRLEGVPIIVLSSRGRQADVRRGFDLGADDYVTKPFSPTALVARVRQLLS